MAMRMDQTQYIRTIEWDMMDKSKFLPLSTLSSFTVRTIVYPLTVIKTRLQIQKRTNPYYSGLFDAAKKIARYEGISGLYKGFWVTSFQIVSGVFYVSTYEQVRVLLQANNIENNRVRALIAGGCASIVGQTIIVPFDVIGQHVMVLGGGVDGKMSLSAIGVNPLRIDYEGKPRRKVVADIIRKVYKVDGVKGFYRGYFASLCTYVPNSALWWTFYHFYQDKLCQLLPIDMSYLLLQSMAATLGGLTTTLLTNPLDAVRARLQVQRLQSMRHTFSSLFREEGAFGMFTKGLTPRLVQSMTFSWAIILGYETIKRISVNQEYRSQIRW